MLSISKEEAKIVHQEFLANNKATFEATSYQQENWNNESGQDKKSNKGINNAK